MALNSKDQSQSSNQSISLLSRTFKPLKPVFILNYTIFFLVMAALLIVTLVIPWQWPLMTGYVLGSICGILSYLVLVASTLLLFQSKKQAVGFTIAFYLLRLLIYAIAIVISARFDNVFNIFSTAAAILIIFFITPVAELINQTLLDIWLKIKTFLNKLRKKSSKNWR